MADRSFEFNLIELVRTRPVLYDVKYADHKHKEARDEVWAEVVQEMKSAGYVVNDQKSLEEKWKILRKKFYRICRDIPHKKATGVGPGAAVEIKWPFFGALIFLIDKIQRRKAPKVPPKQKSPVWEYFDKNAIDDKFACKECGLLVAASGSNTTNLAKHLNRHHNLVVLTESGKTSTEDTGGKYVKRLGEIPEDKVDLFNEAVAKYLDRTAKTCDAAEDPQAPPKSKRSPVWEHFDREAVNGKVRCRLCGIKVASNGNTSNLARHLIKHHDLSVLPESGKKSFQAKATDCESATDKVDRYNQAIIKYLALSCKAYSTVEDQAFIDLLQTFDPKFRPKTQHYFSKKAIPDLVETTRCRIKELLKDVQFCAGTCDTWTNPMMEPFFAFTVHFIHDFQLKSACLECALFEKDHTSDEIALWMLDLMASWELRGKLMSITTDHDSNTCAAVDIVKASHKLLHMRCFGHTANLAATRCYEVTEVEAALQKARKMRHLTTTSSKFKKILREEQATLRLKEATLPADCRTRLWSSLKLLNRCIEQRAAFSETLRRYEKGKFEKWKITEGEADNLKGVIELLDVLKDTVDTLCGDKYCTASLQIPLVTNLKRLSKEIVKRYEDISHGDQDVVVIKLVERCCDLIDEELDHKYAEADESILEKCSFFDPRFKLLTQSWEEDLKQKLLSDISEASSASGVTSSPDIPEPPKKKKLSLLLRANTSSVSADDSVEVEYERYVNTCNLDLDEDPLEWWKENSHSFPRIFKAMLRFLCIPATSTSLQHFISRAGRVYDDNRRSLVAKRSEKLIFLSLNKDFV